MAQCGKCKQVVIKNDVNRSVEVRVIDGEEHTFRYLQPKPLREATGKLKAVYHYKCYMVWQKRLRPTTDERGRWSADTPTAYEQAASMMNKDDLTALAARQAEIAEQRALEQTPRGEDDWRDPIHLMI